MEYQIERDRFDIGASWFKYALLNHLQKKYEKPDCLKENGCINELALADYVCRKCAYWSAIKDIEKMIGDLK